MYARVTVAILLLSAAGVAQSPAPSCPADRPVDEIISQMNKHSSKRNKNPLPGSVCVLGWCRDTRKTPPTLPSPAPKADTPAQTESTPNAANVEKTAEESCNEAMDRALKAAQDVNIGDDHFKHKNYKGALLRYQSARENKPSDFAIQIRLGRVFESLHDSPKALEHYIAARKLGATGKWEKEARAAIARLEQNQR